MDFGLPLGGGGKTASASSSSGVTANYGTDLGQLVPWIVGGVAVCALVVLGLVLWRK